MKGIGDETGRVNEITGDFATLLSGSVDTALQTAQGSTKQLRQELANLEEDLGSKLLPLQRRLTQFKIAIVDAFNYALESDDEKRTRQIDLVADAYKKRLSITVKGQKEISQETVKAGIAEQQILSKNAKAELDALNKLNNFQKQFTKKRADELRNDLIISEGKIKALQGMIKTDGSVVFNPNAGADDPTEKAKGETAEQRAARLLREQQESDKIIKDAKLSLLEEEAREIAMRESKHEEDKKKLRKVSADDRLAFEEAFQQDLADIREKYQLKELQRIDKEYDAINQKAYDNAVARIKQGQSESDDQKQLQADNLKAIQEFVKQSSDLFKSGYEERRAAEQELIQSSRDLIAAGQAVLQEEINRTNKQIGLQEDRVESARKSSTASVKIEEDRLNELIAKRRKYEQAQRVIDAAVIVANQAVAISGAVRTIATSGNPVLIAANVAAIAAGIIASTLAVRNAFIDDGFYEGGFTGEGNPRETSQAQGRRGYKYHKGEFVMNHELTEKHRDMFEGIHKGELMVKQIGDGYYLAPQLDIDNAVSDAGANKAMDFYGLESKLDYIATLLMQRELTVNSYMDADGLTTRISGQMADAKLKNAMRQ